MKIIITHPGGREEIIETAERVVVVYPVLVDVGIDGPSELQVVANHEGLVMDVYTSMETDLDLNIATESETAQEITQRILKNNDL
jgi:hypothetical protein